MQRFIPNLLAAALALAAVPAMAAADLVLFNGKVYTAEPGQALVQAEVYLSGLDVLIKKRQAQVAAQMQRRDQKQMDEFAAMQTQRKLAMLHQEDMS